MRSRIRLLAAFFAITGAAGGAFTVVAHRRAEAALESGRAVSDTLERMVLTAADVAAAQQAYVSPGQPDQPWLERSAALLRQLATAAAAVRPRLRSPNAAATIADIDRALQAMTRIDGAARVDMSQGQSVLAADLIFNEGRDAGATLTTGLRALQAVELSGWTVERARAERQEWLALGSVALAWTIGLLLLLRIGAASDSPAILTEAAPQPVADAVAVAAPESPGLPALDLAAAAEVCAQLARVSDTSSLRAVLERAATVLDARGFVVWLGAGEALFPVLAHGYDDRLLRRLGPIARLADNATADAWRSGELRAVMAGAMTHGAIVVPMATPAGCVGVLATEVAQGREIDPATRAVAVMIAAQLAGVVAALPADRAASPSPETATSGAL
jgi:hypothetical protein